MGFYQYLLLHPKGLDSLLHFLVGKHSLLQKGKSPFINSYPFWHLYLTNYGLNWLEKKKDLVSVTWFQKDHTAGGPLFRCAQEGAVMDKGALK